MKHIKIIFKNQKQQIIENITEVGTTKHFLAVETDKKIEVFDWRIIKKVEVTSTNA